MLAVLALAAGEAGAAVGAWCTALALGSTSSAAALRSCSTVWLERKVQVKVMRLPPSTCRLAPTGVADMRRLGPAGIES